MDDTPISDGSAKLLSIGLVVCSSVVCCAAIAWAVWYWVIRPARAAQAKAAEDSAAKALAEEAERAVREAEDAADDAEKAETADAPAPARVPARTPVPATVPADLEDEYDDEYPAAPPVANPPPPAVSCIASQGAYIPDIYDLGDPVESSLALCCALARGTPGAAGWTLSPEGMCQMKTSTLGVSAPGYVSGSVSGTLLSEPRTVVDVSEASCLVEIPEFEGRATPPYDPASCMGIKLQFKGQCWVSSGERWVTSSGCPAEGAAELPTIEDIKFYTPAVDAGAPTLASTTPTCPDGEKWLDGVCLKTSPGCPPGQRYIASEKRCRMPNAPADIGAPTCQTGYKWLASRSACVKTSPGCPVGMIFSNGACKTPSTGPIVFGSSPTPAVVTPTPTRTPTSTPAPPTCQTGYKWLATKRACAKTSQGCPAGMIFSNGACKIPSTGPILFGVNPPTTAPKPPTTAPKPPAAQTPTCQPGYKWLATKRACAKTSQGCSAGMVFSNGACKIPSAGPILFGANPPATAPKPPTIAPRPPTAAPKPPTAAPSGGESGMATGTAYNIFTSDNTKKGALAEWQVPVGFKVNVVAVHERDWKKYKYMTVNITYKNKTAQFVVGDYCRDSDCEQKTPQCCTRNAQKYGNPKPFLLDMDSRAVIKTWGVKNPEDNFFFPVKYVFGPKIQDVRSAWTKLGAKWDG